MTESEREFWKRKWAQGRAVRRRGWGCGPGFGTDRYGEYGGGKGRGKEKRGRWLWLMIAAGFLAVMILGIIRDEVWGSQGRGQETQAERRMTLGRGQRFQVWETAGRTQEQTDQAGEQPARSGEQESKAWGEPAQPEDGVEIFGLDDFDFSDVNRFLQKENGEPSLTMEGVMADLMEGDLGGLCRRMANALKQSLFSEISIGSRLIGQVLALGLVGAVFTNFSTVFQGSEISETGFFITYLLLFTFLAASMMESMALTAGVVEDVLEFMGILMPSYFLAVAFAGGSVSAVVMYEFTLWVVADSSPGEDLCAFSHGGESGEGGVSVPADGTFGTGCRVGAENAAGAGAGVPSDSGADTALCGFPETGSCGEGGFHDSGYRTGGVCGDQAAGGLRRSD